MPVDLSYPSEGEATTLGPSPSASPLYLSPLHQRALVEKSGIAPEIVAERGYATISSLEKLSGFKKEYQRRLGLLIPVRSPSGTTGQRLRPDQPRKNKKGKPVKYEQPSGTPNMLDVLPRNIVALGDASVDLWVTEGEKKADSLTSQGLCTVAMFGVWGWCVKGTKGRELLPCWDHIKLSGRRVYVVFDSDLMVKENVQLALERLAAALEARGAEVLVVYLPSPEKGVDDFLVAGGTVSELKVLAHRFKPKDLTRVRLSRDERLRERISELWARWREMPVKTRAEPSLRSVARVLILQAEKSGRPVDEGVRVTLSSRTGAERAEIGQKTWLRAVATLEASEYLRIEKAPRKDKENSYVLKTGRALVTQYGGSKAKTERFVVKREYREPPSSAEFLNPPPRRESPVRASDEVPELRWSRVIVNWYKDGTGYRVCEVSPLERLGKKRQWIIAYLLESVRSVTVAELMQRFAGERARARDFKSRMLKPLEDAGVIAMEGDGVRLAVGWREALENRRELGEEHEAAESQKKRHELQRDAFHNRTRSKPDPHPANVGADGYVEELEPAKPEDLEELVVDDFEDLVADFEDLEPAPELLVGIGADTPYNTSKSADTLSDAGEERTGAQRHSRYENSTAWKEKPSHEKFRRMWVDPEKEKFFFPERYQKAG